MAVLEFPPSESFRSHVRTCSVRRSANVRMWSRLYTHRITVGHKVISFLLSLLSVATRGCCERGNNFAKSCKRFVDVCTLFQPLASRAGGVRTLGTSEINQAISNQTRVYGEYRQETYLILDTFSVSR